MNLDSSARRSFLKASALAFGTAALPWRDAMAATGVRLEWQQFKTTKWYAPYLDAIAQMRTNTNPSSKNSWQYWVNVHLAYCPHEISYFLAWHRGYLYYFEQQLRSITRMSDLVLPYWDYYLYATIPAEFMDAATGNPLYVPNRVSGNVLSALTMAPFAPTITNFPRGLSNAYEPTFEMQPHNPVHNLIGGVMATMSSPTDPIFYLHHASVDRLWLAWVLAAGGRQMPPRSNSYWGGSFTYATSPPLTMPRSYTYDTLTNLSYNYAVDILPPFLPLALNGKKEGGLIRVQATPTLPALPPVANAHATAARGTGPKTFSIGGVSDLTLDERSVSVVLPVAAAHSAALEALAGNGTASIPGSTLQFKSAQIVVQGARTLNKGAQGGYFYYVYLNLPATPDFMTPKEQLLIGTLGPFEVEAAMHHDPVDTIPLQITDKLAGMSAQQLSQVTVSFVRVNGENAPTGQVMSLGEVRLELNTDAIRS